MPASIPLSVLAEWAVAWVGSQSKFIDWEFGVFVMMASRISKVFSNIACPCE
jgi:hypothetical protein